MATLASAPPCPTVSYDQPQSVSGPEVVHDEGYGKVPLCIPEASPAEHSSGKSSTEAETPSHSKVWKKSFTDLGLLKEKASDPVNSQGPIEEPKEESDAGFWQVKDGKHTKARHSSAGEMQSKHSMGNTLDLPKAKARRGKRLKEPKGSPRSTFVKPAHHTWEVPSASENESMSDPFSEAPSEEVPDPNALLGVKKSTTFAASSSSSSSSESDNSVSSRRFFTKGERPPITTTSYMAMNGAASEAQVAGASSIENQYSTFVSSMTGAASEAQVGGASSIADQYNSFDLMKDAYDGIVRKLSLHADTEDTPGTKSKIRSLLPGVDLSGHEVEDSADDGGRSEEPGEEDAGHPESWKRCTVVKEGTPAFDSTGSLDASPSMTASGSVAAPPSDATGDVRLSQRCSDPETETPHVGEPDAEFGEQLPNNRPSFLAQQMDHVQTFMCCRPRPATTLPGSS